MLPPLGTTYFFGGGPDCSATWRFLGLTIGLRGGEAAGDRVGERKGDFSASSMA